MLSIRLKRMGSKQRPVYRIVVSDSRKRPTGRAVEELGSYDPRSNPPVVRLDRERAAAWLAKGAKPSDTVRSLLKQTQEASA